MLSRDESGLDAASKTANRWRLLRDQGVEMVVLIASRKAGAWEEENLQVVGTGGGTLSRFFRVLRLARPLAPSADLITAQDPFELGFIAWRLSASFHKPFEIQDHGGFFDGEKPDEPLWFFRGRLAGFLARRARLIRTVSPKSLARLKQLGLKGDVYHLPIVADPRFSRIERKPETHLIVSIGRLISVKRHALTIQAFARLKKTVPDARLIIVGEGPLRIKLESLATRLGVADTVEFAGHADPAPYLSRAALFVLLSSHEGWGIAAVEAALAGVPVLMTNTGCAKWLEGQGGAIVVTRDISIKEACQSMQKMLFSEKTIPQLGEALSFVEAVQKQADAWRMP